MYCRHCGSQLPEGGKFCPNCGQPVETDHTNNQGSSQKGFEQQWEDLGRQAAS